MRIACCLTVVAMVMGLESVRGEEPPRLRGEWTYNSFLLLPTKDQLQSPPGTKVDSYKWAFGKLSADDSGTKLAFAPDVFLNVNYELAKVNGQWRFVGEGVGEGKTKGAIYRLVGWVSLTSDGNVKEVQGSIIAVRGPDATPDVELAKRPIGTVGCFLLTR